MNIIEYSTSEHLLKALEAKRIEAIYLNVDVAKYQMNSKSILNLIFKPDLPSSSGSYHISTVKHPQLIKLINLYIQENANFIQEQEKKLQIK